MTIKELDDLNNSIKSNLLLIKKEIDNNYLIKLKQINDLFDSYPKINNQNKSTEMKSKNFDSFFELKPIGFNIHVVKFSECIQLNFNKSYNNQYLNKQFNISKYSNSEVDTIHMVFTSIEDDYYKVLLKKDSSIYAKNTLFRSKYRIKYTFK